MSVSRSPPHAFGDESECSYQRSVPEMIEGVRMLGLLETAASLRGAWSFEGRVLVGVRGVLRETWWLAAAPPCVTCFLPGPTCADALCLISDHEAQALVNGRLIPHDGHLEVQGDVDLLARLFQDLRANIARQESGLRSHLLRARRRLFSRVRADRFVRGRSVEPETSLGADALLGTQGTQGTRGTQGTQGTQGRATPDACSTSPQSVEPRLTAKTALITEEWTLARAERLLADLEALLLVAMPSEICACWEHLEALGAS